MLETLGVPLTFGGGFKLFWSLTSEASGASLGFIVGWSVGVCLFSFIVEVIRITAIHVWRAIWGPMDGR